MLCWHEGSHTTELPEVSHVISDKGLKLTVLWLYLLRPIRERVAIARAIGAGQERSYGEI